jgi:rubrerythrin
MKFNKRVLKESNTEALSGPKIGPDAGLSALLISAINGEWETINEYNTLAINAREEGYHEMAAIIDEINTEENKHVGQLQKALEMISPNTTAIESGEEEATHQIDDDDSWYDESIV